jgi:hypothetical protein
MTYQQYDDTDYRQCAECKRWIDFAYPDINDGVYQVDNGKTFCSDECHDHFDLMQKYDTFAAGH